MNWRQGLRLIWWFTNYFSWGMGCCGKKCFLSPSINLHQKFYQWKMFTSLSSRNFRYQNNPKRMETSFFIYFRYDHHRNIHKCQFPFDIGKLSDCWEHLLNFCARRVSQITILVCCHCVPYFFYIFFPFDSIFGAPLISDRSCNQ